MEITLKKISDDSNKSSGTSFQGVCFDGTTYAKLIELFGEPTYEGSGDDKVKAEWVLVAGDGSVATIYDYKDSRPVEEITGIDWHIGGHSLTLAVKEVLALSYSILNPE